MKILLSALSPLNLQLALELQQYFVNQNTGYSKSTLMCLLPEILAIGPEGTDSISVKALGTGGLLLSEWGRGEEWMYGLRWNRRPGRWCSPHPWNCLKDV